MTRTQLVVADTGPLNYLVLIDAIRMIVSAPAAHIPLVRRAMRKYIRGIYFREESRDRSIPQMG